MIKKRLNCMLTRSWCVCKFHSIFTILSVQILVVGQDGSKIEVLGLSSTRLGRVFDFYCKRQGLRREDT